MYNVDPPSRFTAYILLHTYTQRRPESSAENGYRLQDFSQSACQHAPALGASACQLVSPPRLAGFSQARGPSLSSFPCQRESAAPGSLHLRSTAICRIMCEAYRIGHSAGRCASKGRGGISWTPPRPLSSVSL